MLIYVGLILSRPKTQVKHKKNLTLIGSFKVPTKTQVNTKFPQSHNLNPILAKICVFNRGDTASGRVF